MSILKDEVFGNKGDGVGSVTPEGVGDASVRVGGILAPIALSKAGVMSQQGPVGGNHVEGVLVMGG